MSQFKVLGSDHFMKDADSRIAGALIFVASAQFIIALIVAEAFYPNYSIAQNFISDLGATCRATCLVVQPTSTIFNSSVTLLGLLAIVASYFMQRGFRSRILTAFVIMTGVGAAGVGVFPETAGVIHHVVSLITFVFAGLSAIASYKLQKAPLSYFSILLGVVTLVALALYASNTFLGLGPGGMERMIVYPALVWAAGLGAHLIGYSKTSASP
jgi:hypothetical membrane protein